MIHTAFFALWCGWGGFGCGIVPVIRSGRAGVSAIITGILLSFIILYSSALFLQIAEIPLRPGSWLMGSIVLSVLLCFVPRACFQSLSLRETAPRRAEAIQLDHQGGLRPPRDDKRGFTTRLKTFAEKSSVAANKETKSWRWIGYLFILAFIFAAAAVIYRAIVHPLSGADVSFRWDLLAEQIVRTGGFSFYPPMSDADFGRYMWPESIPPLVALLHAWCYFGAGNTTPATTAPFVLLVAALAFLLVFVLAQRRGGLLAGASALALLATSAIHTNAVSMGQETGLVTAGLLGLIWTFDRADAGGPDWVDAAIAASVVALSRDYGGLAILLGIVMFFMSRCSWRVIGGFAALCAVIVGPWYLRTWWRTGNPVYNHDVFGWFPCNEMQLGLMHFYARNLGFVGHLSRRISELSGLWWVLGPAVLLAGVGSFVRTGAWRREACLVAVAWIAIWIWSVAYTAGGIQYSMRVLSPVLALMAVGGGTWLASFAHRRWLPLVAVLLVAVAAEASLRALIAFNAPNNIPMEQWFTIGQQLSAPRGDASFDRIAARVGSARVLVTDVYQYSFLIRRGVSAVPPWTPSLAFLTTETEVIGSVRKLRLAGVQYFLVSPALDLRAYFLGSPALHGLQEWMEPIDRSEDWMLYRWNEKALQL